MPVRHALSAKRGLPPLGFALATGMNGSTSFHNPSGNARKDVATRSQGLLQKLCFLDVLKGFLCF